jgi:hypothetical protein
MTAPDKLEALRDLLDEDAVAFDGLDDAVIGVGMQHTGKALLVYDRDKIIECLMTRDGIDHEEAEDLCSFKIDCLCAGSGTPIILRRAPEWADSDVSATLGQASEDQ